MGEKNLWSKLGLIVLLVGICAWQVWPPGEKLKPGIDLGGGHSLLFEVDDSGLAANQRENLAERVMAILKQRVDPQGNRNLIWRPIGWNRIEIQMPRPPESQAKHREAFENARDALIDTSITEAQIRAALAMQGDERAQAFEAMVGPITSRKTLFDELIEANDRYWDLKAAATQPIDSELAQKIDDTFLRRRALIEDILATNLDVRVLGDILELDKKSNVRAEKLETLKEQHTELAGHIDAMVAGYDEWAAAKGALDDPSDLMRLLRGAGKLEFRILAQRDQTNPSRTLAENKPQYSEEVQKYIDQLAKYGPRPREGDNFQWFLIDKPDENSITDPPFIVSEYLAEKYVLSHSTPDMGLLNTGKNEWSLRGAFQGLDQQGRPAVNFELDARGGRMFAELTRENIGRPLCIFLDGKAISSATIRSEIGTNGQISGNFSMEEVAQLINTLDAGVLPARLKEVPLQQKSVGPALGKTNRDRGMQAIIVAFVLTIAFMTVYYSYNGVIADIALLINLIITLGVMSFIQATFTLPGIAGLVLTLGMAVDANVLIYERMREELARGVSVRQAVKLGYEKAFSAILDSNVTTIITAVILGSLGSEEIKGFGLTLGIGLCTSMFTALFVTRQYFNIMVPSTLNSDETRRAWLGTGTLVAAGAVLMGLGYLLNADPIARAESPLWGLGRFLMVMFVTAAILMLSLWAFRIAYKSFGHQKANKLPMMRLFSAPNIDWMGKYKIFWTVSTIVIVTGLIFESSVHTDEYLDIEFLGGTSVQLEIKDEEADAFAERGDEKLMAYIRGNDETEQAATSVGWLNHAAEELAEATVTAQGDNRYLLQTDEPYTIEQMRALLLPVLEDYLVRGGITKTAEGTTLQFDPNKAKDPVTDLDGVQARIDEASAYLASAADKIRNARVQLVEEDVASGETRRAFEVITTETQRSLVAEAILASMGDILVVTTPIEADLYAGEDALAAGYFPIKQSDNTLADVMGGDISESVAEFKGGVLLVFEDLNPPATAANVEQRLREMRLQPDFEEIGWREAKVIGLTAADATTENGNPLFTRIAIAVTDPSLPYVEGEENQTWRSEVAAKELDLAQAALASSRSLQRVTQFAPQVAGEAVQKAVIAIILSMIAIAGYLWVRFGSVEFGLAGIIALYHDVAVTLSCVMACHHLHDTFIGDLLMLSDFRIDLAMIAAFLTIVGYSINDSIVIFDRIRENRGRLATVSVDLINSSLNQTLSRTLITSLTTFVAVAAMYVVGGEGIHGFAFAMIVGVISGTYSTIAIATPMLQHPRAMWVVLISLVTITALAIVNTVGIAPLRYTLWVLIAIAALAAFIRQWSVTAASRPATATS